MLLKPDSVASPPNSPASTPPREEAKNHKPIIWPRYFLEYLEKADKPTGDKASSPKVCNNLLCNKERRTIKSNQIVIQFRKYWCHAQPWRIAKASKYSTKRGSITNWR